MFFRHCFLLTLVIALTGHTDSVAAHLDGRILAALYQKYIRSTNVSDREEMKLLLQRQLDCDPVRLLSISGLDVTNICDGSDIDADSGINRNLMLQKTSRRIEKIKFIAVNIEKKRLCLSSLERFKGCVVEQNC